MSSPPRVPWLRATQAQLLQPGADSAWASLGLWSEGDDHPAAATALADLVGRAAGLGPGQRVLSLACGAGDELLLWRDRFGVAEVLGVERDPSAAAMARVRLERAGENDRAIVLTADAMRLDAGALGRFDAVLCVDAAYHLAPRRTWLKQAHALLRPGGRLAFTDLSRPAEAAQRRGLRAAARLCGLSFDELLDDDAQCERLRAAGFVDVALQRLDAPVLDGFVRFVATQRRRLGRAAWQPAWLRPAITAALIPPCRRLGLGYALLSARRP